jgi:hypothetical protein
VLGGVGARGFSSVVLRPDRAALASDRSLVTSRTISFYFPFLVKKILSEIAIFGKFCM